jgi:hypothetical protein
VTRRICLLAAAGVAAALAFPTSAAAHGIGQRADLPIPEWLFGWGAALVLIVSFVALAILWPKPQLQEPHRTRVGRVPVFVDVVCGAIGVALFGLAVYSGLAGTQTSSANLTPTLVYVVFWVGLVVGSVLFGDIFGAFSPWRSVARGVSWLSERFGSRPPAAIPYPEWLGRWPAAVGIVAFAWLELAYQEGSDPSTLAVLAVAYALVQLAGMSFFGIDAWTKRADAFGVYFNLFARLSAWERDDDRVLYLRRPLSGVTSLDPVPGTVAVMCAAIGTTSFDGFSQGKTWASLSEDLQQPFLDLGFSASTALELAATIGLVTAVFIVAGLFRLGIAGMHTVGKGHSTRELARDFAHTLAPIACAYVLAHYFSLLIFQGQAMAFLASDPLGDGSDIFGTASATIDYNAIRPQTIWYVQVGALVVGHVAGLILAHDKAIAIYKDPREATRSQYWMLMIMIGFTSLGLWLLSAINSNA